MVLRLATYAMGTRFELVLGGEDAPRLRAAGEEAVAVIQEWHSRLNRFAPESQLSFINRTAAERPVRLDEDLYGLVELCRRVHHDSEGAFDPTARTAQAPEAAAGAVGFELVELDRESRTMRFAAPGLRLDLGGIAKGFALDAAEHTLRTCGVRSALVHGGTSSIVAIGTPEDREGWAVSVASLGEPVSVLLRDAHLSVSAPRGRVVTRGPELCGHIVDPRDGSNADLARTAAVLGAQGAEAEAWSTAIAVLGERPGRMPAGFASAVHERATGWRCAGHGGAAFECAGARGLHRAEVA